MKQRVVSCLISIAGVAACGGDDSPASVDAGIADDAAIVSPDADTRSDVAVQLLTFNHGYLAPAEFVAVQDGDGPWQRLESTSGLYEFTPESGRYGIATVCPLYNSFERLVFVFGTAAELPRTVRRCGMSPRGTASINVTVSGLSGPQMLVEAKDANVLFSGNNSYAITDLPAEVHDVVFTVFSNNNATRVALERDIGLSLSPVELPLDAFVDTQAMTAFSIGAATALGSGDEHQAGAALLTRHGTRAFLMRDQTRQTYGGVPAGLLAAPDVHVAHVLAFNPTTSIERATYEFFRTARNVSAPYPAAFELTSVSAAGVIPYVRLALEFAAYPNANLYYVRALQNGRRIAVNITPGWLGAAANHSWQEPDLSSVPGWDSAWALQDNLQTTVHATAFTISAGNAFTAWHEYEERVPLSEDRDGVVMTRARSSTTFTP